MQIVFLQGWRSAREPAPQRAMASRLYQALAAGGRRIAAGERDAEAVKAAAMALLAEEPGMRVEYLEIADESHMQPVARTTGPVCVAAAVWVGRARLIDNLRASPARS